MNQSTAIAMRGHAELPDATTWQTMLSMAEAFLSSGLLPAAIKTPQAAVTVIQKGRELGIPPLYALSKISVINGKPVTESELMLALIYRDHGDNAIRITHTDPTGCTLLYKRRSWPEHQEFSFTVEDAKRAGLLGKGGVWNQYPQAMLRARCISAVARLAFPDSIGGMYTAEELGVEVAVTDDGEVTVVDAPKPPLEIVQADRRAEAIMADAEPADVGDAYLTDIRAHVAGLTKEQCRAAWDENERDSKALGIENLPEPADRSPQAFRECLARRMHLYTATLMQRKAEEEEEAF